MKPLFLLAFGGIMVGGCTLIEDVKPWEKENHAKAIMQLGGVSPAVSKYESHTYFSKEASHGGSGVSGGGCGCN